MDITGRKVDQDGILSLDMLAGFSIFLLALIAVFAMVPSVLAGIDCSGADYDAVAYRTSVILAEYPGDPCYPPWETIPASASETISCLGLACSRQNPCILSEQKVERLFSCSDPEVFTSDDIRRTLLFEGVPCQYNLSIAAGELRVMKGNPVPEHEYGFARRLIQVRTPAIMSIDACSLDISLPPGASSRSADITTCFNYTSLADPAISEPYRIRPSSDQMTITLTNISEALAGSDCSGVQIQSIDVLVDGESSPVSLANDSFQLCIDGMGKDPQTHPDILGAGNLTLTLYPPLPFCDRDDVIVDVILRLFYQFSDTESIHTCLAGVQFCDYDSDWITQPSLIPGVLEVCIW